MTYIHDLGIIFHWV